MAETTLKKSIPLSDDDGNAWVIPLVTQEGWRAERRGGYPLNPKSEVAIITTPAPGATPPQLRRGAMRIDDFGGHRTPLQQLMPIF